MTRFIISITLIITILYTIGSCSDNSDATLSVIKDKVYNTIESAVGRGDIAIKQYEISIEKTRNALIKIKISKKLLEQSISEKKKNIDELDISKKELEKSSIKYMLTTLSSIKDVESSIEKKLKSMVANFDIVKAKITALEVRKNMLEILTTVEQYQNVDDDIGGISSEMNIVMKKMEKDILSLEAELEVNNLLKDMK